MEANTTTENDEAEYEIVRDGYTFDQSVSCRETLRMAGEGDVSETERGDKIEVEYRSAATGYEKTTTVSGRIISFNKNKILLVRDSDHKKMSVETAFGEYKTDWHDLDVRTEGRLVGVIDKDATDHGISLLRDNWEKVEVKTDGGDDDDDNDDDSFEVGDEYTDGDVTIEITGKSKSGRGVECREGNRQYMRHGEKLMEKLEEAGFSKVENARHGTTETVTGEVLTAEAPATVVQSDGVHDREERAEPDEEGILRDAEGLMYGVEGWHVTDVEQDMDTFVYEVAHIEAVTDFAATDDLVIVGIQGDVEEPPEEIRRHATDNGFRRDRQHHSDQILEYYGFGQYETNFVYVPAELVTDGGASQQELINTKATVENTIMNLQDEIEQDIETLRENYKTLREERKALERLREQIEEARDEFMVGDEYTDGETHFVIQVVTPESVEFMDESYIRRVQSKETFRHTISNFERKEL